MNTLFWHDYETFGIDPRRDRVAQFAGVRTDEALQPLGEEVVAWCRIADDYLPHPGACLITGITPQTTLARGASEAEFARTVHQHLATPGTCGVGYNSIRFDDEFTRFLLYRNFYDPYAREWQHGNSRWDLIDAMRLAHALRPQGLEWPLREDGSASFRLEELTRANDIGHASAHDALSDVHATIAVARLLRERQPRLYDYVYGQRARRRVAALLDCGAPRVVLHVSEKYPASSGCIAPVAALAETAGREIVVFDLRQDPALLLDLDAAQIAHRVFTPGEQLAADTPRLPLKTVRLNRAPVVVPATTLTDLAAQRWDIDLPRCRAHLAAILPHRAELAERLAQVFVPPPRDAAAPGVDPEVALYERFVDDPDRELFGEIRAAREAPVFAALAARLRDPRLPELLFRYRARNYPDTLEQGEIERWQAHRRARLLAEDAQQSLPWLRRELARELAREDLDGRGREVLQALDDYAGELAASL